MRTEHRQEAAAAPTTGAAPDPFDARPQGRRRGTVTAIAAVAAVLALGAGLLVTGQVGADADLGLRTATAGVHDVAAQLRSVATIEAVSQAAVSFPVAGTVAQVDVTEGDQVVIGQQLAALDTVELERELHKREAALADAELTLAEALAGEVADEGTSASPGIEPTSAAASLAVAVPAVLQTTAVDLSATAVADPAGDGELAALQQAVIDAQADVDSALVGAGTALDTAEAICVSSSASAASSEPSGQESGVGEATMSSLDTAACTEALVAVRAAQQQAVVAEQVLVSASTALDAELAERATAGPASESSGSSSAGSGATGSEPPSSSEPDVEGATGSAPSAARLAAYQKALDAAALSLLVAEQAVAQATIASPVAGEVVAVAIRVGDDVSASSATQVITIQGEGGYEASLLVPLSEVAEVAIGQEVALVPDGSSTVLAGEVVGVAAAPSASTSTSYRVTVGLHDADATLRSGATAAAVITTAATERVLAVPTSAVHREAGRAVVEVVEGTSIDAAVVELGVVGPEWTEVRSGLDDGDVVVLADLDEPLADSATATATGSSLGGPPTFGGAPPGG
jgi:multidrug efflux pump subunit AcrA (membrane-fusion protein)